MSRTTSLTTGRLYGVQRACRAWEQPKSSHYALVRRVALVPGPAPARKRGPKTAVSDADLLASIKEVCGPGADQPGA